MERCLLLQSQPSAVRACPAQARNQRKCAVVCRSTTASSSAEVVSRRALGSLTVGLAMMQLAGPAHAGFSKDLKKKKLVESDYTISEDVGLPILDLEEGRGTPAKLGDRVVVHFDAIYRGIDVQSSRSARLLGGNRTLAEPYIFVVGDSVAQTQAKLVSPDGGGGLYAGQSGPTPPPALSRAVVGMKRGGKRVVLVNKPELGYGEKGIQEIPPNGTFELKVELLELSSN